MRFAAFFFDGASRAFRNRPTFSKLAVILVGGSGGLVAYADAKSEQDIGLLQGTPKKKVVVLGTGWAATSFLRNLDSSKYDVQVISPRNYFAFTPLLPSVTCGTVEARSIIEPVRNIIRKKSGEIKFWEAECFKIDPANKRVHCHRPVTNSSSADEFLVDYDYLVIAIGARANTFNIPGVEENCHFLKEIEDAQKIRRSVMDCFERASLPNLDEEERKKNLHFVIVGGGPTGVEFAAELHDFVSGDLSKLYPSVCDLVKISVIEAGEHILTMNSSCTVDKAAFCIKLLIYLCFSYGMPLFNSQQFCCFATMHVISTMAWLWSLFRFLIGKEKVLGLTKGLLNLQEKFRRDGIDVKTGFKVVKVSHNGITMTANSTGEISVPYGMAVWSTGIGTRPVIVDFMKQIDQGNRRVLATDEWLRVRGCDGVYALGDCATISQRKVMEDISEIFRVADKDNSGTLTAKEIQDVLEDICIRYPQVELYMRSKQMSGIADLLKDSKGDVKKEATELSIEEFKKALADVDSQVKTLPATAQVAAQQGNYLARCFNKLLNNDDPEGPLRIRESGRHRFRPFRYKHLGQFAPLGGEQTAAQLPGDWISIGHSSQWLWYSVYATKQVSWRTRILVISDWTKRIVFGRDSSCI
ncbi:hypothetical protein HPP92_004168 [Vanilla planifolia]|uniref:NADH:ubiquinone reductase (non-electrogenic) n=1 Tax=Vanilla planifolia TaxID=51239 RepID=A0A835VHW0_VANPL|nr:hypothetical protein HPP92_004168 [Vanilla planifolia]